MLVRKRKETEFENVIDGARSKFQFSDSPNRDRMKSRISNLTFMVKYNLTKLTFSIIL